MTRVPTPGAEAVPRAAGPGAAPAPVPPPVFVDHGADFVTVGWTPAPIDDQNPEEPVLYCVQSKQTTHIAWDADLTLEPTFTRAGAQPGAYYAFRVAVQRGAGPWSAFTAAKEVRAALLIPHAPPSPVLVDHGLDSLTFRLVPPDGLAAHPGSLKHFHVQTRPRGAGAAAWDTQYAQGPACVVPGLAAGTEYDARAIVETFDGVASAPSPEVACETMSTCPAQMCLWEGQVNYDSVLVMWKPPADNGRAVEGYELECASTSNGILCTTHALAPGLRQHTLAELHPAHVYAVRIRARNAHGPGAWSDPVEILTEHALPGVPGTPALVRRTSHMLHVRWAPPPKIHADVKRYLLQYREATATDWVAECTTEPECLVPGLKADTEYGFRVYCQNTKGMYSQFSGVGEFRTLSSRPEAPAPLQLAASTATSLTFRWSIADWSKGITRYRFRSCPALGKEWRDDYYCPPVPDAPPGVSTGAPIALEHTLEGLRPATHYVVVLCAENEHGFGAYNERATFHTANAAPDAPPPPALARAECTSLKLLLTQPCKNGAQISWYRLDWRRNFDDEWQQASWNALSTVEVGKNPIRVHHALFDLVPFGRYRFRFACENACGWSEWSEEAEFETLPDVPGCPADVQLRAPPSVALTWRPAPHRGAKVLRYQLSYRRAEEADAEVKLVTRRADEVREGHHCLLKLPALAANTRYDIRLRAENRVGWGAWATLVTAI